MKTSARMLLCAYLLAAVAMMPEVTGTTADPQPISTSAGATQSTPGSTTSSNITTPSNSPRSTTASSGAVAPGSTGTPTGSSQTTNSPPLASTSPPDVCLNYTCNTSQNCLDAAINNASFDVPTCPRANKYCKVTKTLLAGTYTIVAACVDDNCNQHHEKSSAGETWFDCCHASQCNKEDILNAGSLLLPGFLPFILAPVVAMLSVV